MTYFVGLHVPTDFRGGGGGGATLVPLKPFSMAPFWSQDHPDVL